MHRQRKHAFPINRLLSGHDLRRPGRPAEFYAVGWPRRSGIAKEVVLDGEIGVSG